MMSDTSLERALDHFVDERAEGRPVIVASDFDGVLAPLVLNPADSTPLPGTIEALSAMGQHDGVRAAVVSGRDLDTLRRLTGLRGDDVILIGSHGVEWSTRAGMEPTAELTDDQRASLAAATAELNEVITRHPEARIEHKPAGVVLHTRGMDDAQAQAAATEALAIPHHTRGVAAMKGKSVVELTVLKVTKGSALTSLAAHVGDAAVLYLGDDVTDESAFKVLPASDGHVTIKVGDGETAASQRVAGPQEAADLLIDLAQRFAG